MYDTTVNKNNNYFKFLSTEPDYQLEIAVHQFSENLVPTRTSQIKICVKWVKGIFSREQGTSNLDKIFTLKRS